MPHGGRLPALGGGFGAVVVVGMHAMSGTPRAFLEHTVDPDWHRYRIDGVDRGEFALVAYTASACGVPTVFVCGDRAAVEEARALVPGIEAVAVKEGLARDWCRSVAPAAAHERIRAGVARALARRAEIAPPALTFPASIRLEFNRCSGADAFDGRRGIWRLDGFSIDWTAHDSSGLVP